MTTRDRILKASLTLFNVEGAAVVTASRIAAELGMSQGNLHYHFRRKQEIADRLVRRFEQEAEPLLAGPSSDLASLDDLWLFLHLTFEKLFEYRFIYREVDYLLTEFPPLGPRLRDLTVRGIDSVTRICAQLAAVDCLRANQDEIEVLAVQMMMTATCWFTFARILPETEDVGPGRAAYQVLSLLSPFVADTERSYIDYLRQKYRA
jgi:AcrR family transcriptional regulator